MPSLLGSRATLSICGRGRRFVRETVHSRHATRIASQDGSLPATSRKTAACYPLFVVTLVLLLIFFFVHTLLLTLHILFYTHAHWYVCICTDDITNAASYIDAAEIEMFFAKKKIWIQPAEAKELIHMFDGSEEGEASAKAPPVATENLLENTDGVLRGGGGSEHPISVLSGRQPATF